MLLKRALVLYKDRQRIALAAMLVLLFVVTYLFYTAPILKISSEIPPIFPQGWAKGFEVVYSFNTIGFFLALSIMVFLYAFWTWAFLPAPAELYTMAILRGIFGTHARLTKLLGKKFRVTFGNGRYIEIVCRMRNFDEWFVYRLTSSPFANRNLQMIALRHGMHVENNRFTTWVSNDELHHRLLLMAKAMTLV